MIRHSAEWVPESSCTQWLAAFRSLNHASDLTSRGELSVRSPRSSASAILPFPGLFSGQIFPLTSLDGLLGKGQRRFRRVWK